MNKKILLLICFCLLIMNLQATIRYVKTDGITSAEEATTATSWATACADLQAVINASAANDEIWVAAGIYKPNRRADALNSITPNNRDNAFVLKKDVKIYGSFSGEENTLEERQLFAFGDYTSILSGDIGDFNDISDNCYHVIISVDNAGDACLDGFVITEGNANGNSSISIQLRPSSSMIVHQNYGGGVYINRSSPVLSNLNINGNTATYGGGMTNFSSSPVIFNVDISRNTANTGGGMYNYNWSSDEAKPILTNVTICGNTANNNGGGIYNSSSSPTLTNVSISRNTANNNGGGIDNNRSSPQIRNSIIWGNGIASITTYGGSPVYSYSLVEGITAEGVILSNINPFFENAENGDLRLQKNSSCINTGDNTLFDAGKVPDLSAITTDLAGNPRIIDGKIDLGAYEFSGQPTNIHIVSGQKNNITSYPNPAISGETVTLQLNETCKNGKWTLFNLNGNAIKTGKIENQQEIKINTVNLVSGIYLVKLSDESWQLTEMLIIK